MTVQTLPDFQFYFRGTAPGCDIESHAVMAMNEQEAKYEARQALADILGVRADHIVMRLVTKEPIF